MARRKRQFLDDDDDSDSTTSSGNERPDFANDPDAQEERALFENPYKRKRQRRSGKEDAIYGIFGEDSDEDGMYGLKSQSESKKKSDWAKAPAFVAGDKVDLHETTQVDEGDDEGNTGDPEDADEDEDDGPYDEEDEVDGTPEGEEDLEDSVSSKPSSPRMRGGEDEVEAEPSQRPRFGGIGSGKLSAEQSSSFSFTKGGIGSSRIVPATLPASTLPTSASGPSTVSPTDNEETITNSDPLPEGFTGRSQRAFVRSTPPATKPVVNLPAHERAHFSSLSSLSFGARMMAKMGWQAGTGLGAAGEGIVIPVESKMRPKNMGIAFKGFKEKTDQAKFEAKRRGEVVSDDEVEMAGNGRGGKKGSRKEKDTSRSDAWKKVKKMKTKIQHKTYEQIVAEAGQEPLAAPGIGQIIDATGTTPREVSSLADLPLSSWTPSTDPTRIPELRHNLRLIADACKTDLDGLAREAKALEERKKWIIQEDIRVRKNLEEEAELISRLQQIKLIVDDINVQAKESASLYEVSLDPFSPYFTRLLVQFPTEFDRYHLDEIVVAAIAPSVRRMVAQWNPLEDPSVLISNFRSWRQALKMNDDQELQGNAGQVDVYGARAGKTVFPASTEKSMTPFESLLWNVWLPKVRTSINNDWNPSDAEPAIKLYSIWTTCLPRFIKDNILDQLILPKLSKAVADWSPRKGKGREIDQAGVSLQRLIFPWLPYLGLRVEDVLDDARRKVKGVVRGWNVGDGVPEDLAVWRDVFNAGDWDSMVLKYVVPKLGSHLRTYLHINPRQQDLEPLNVVLSWSPPLIRPSIFGQLLLAEFFPKWLDVLHLWLVQPTVSFEEVAQWYEWWKNIFGDKLAGAEGVEAVQKGFTRGLQLMNKAIELGPRAPTALMKPDLRAELSPAITTPSRVGPASTADLPGSTIGRTLPLRSQDITFRSIAEEFASSHNLLFVPIGRAHEKSRMPLFRVTSSADLKKGGLLVYLLDDAVWAPILDSKTGGVDEYGAITLEDMVLRASR